MDLGLVEGACELLGVQDVGEVHEGAGRGRDADAVVGGGVGVAGAVRADALVPALCRRRHFDRRLPPREDPPKRRRRPVAQRGVGTAGQHGRHRRGER